MPSCARGSRQLWQIPGAQLLLLLLLAFCGQPTAGQIVGLNVLNPFQLLQQLGLFTDDTFFADMYNLFFGKRRLVCGMKLLTIFGRNPNNSLFGVEYRENSVMILPEAGIYEGIEDIEEYVSFATQASPYIASGPGLPHFEPRIVGFNGEECEYHWSILNFYEMDATLVEQQASFTAPLLIKIFMDYDEVYMRRAYVHYTKPFLAYFFSLLATRSTAEFVCNEVWGSAACAQQLGVAPPPDDCVERMLELPLATGDLFVDGDSFGCRLLHAAFAHTNARHCAHVSLDPLDTDPDGGTVCAESSQLPLTDFFTTDEMEQFVQFAQVGSAASCHYVYCSDVRLTLKPYLFAGPGSGSRSWVYSNVECSRISM